MASIEHNPNGFDSWVRPVYLGRKMYRIVDSKGYPELDGDLKEIRFETKEAAEGFLSNQGEAHE